jgi:predicted HAD superfamily Cof-like phosphohydrolase
MHGVRQMGIDRAWEDVRAFCLAFGYPAPEAPELLHADSVERRAAWIEEEADELREAETVADQADAFIDIIYFALGGLVNIGVRPERLWDIVQAANMAKLWPDGRPHLRPGDGKVIKPDGWQDPRPLLEAEIERQRRDGALTPLRPRRAKVA